MSKMIEKASLFAEVAHAAVGQKRKYTNDPYIVHPRAVAKLVHAHLHLPDEPVLRDQIIASALLHDVVEDTKVTLDLIEDHFGPVVRRIVYEVTDVSRPNDGNRMKRKAMDREHIAKASPEAKTIKLADLIDNTKSIVKYDPGFAKTYLEEKRLLLSYALTVSLTPDLYTMAMKALNDALSSIYEGKHR